MSDWGNAISRKGGFLFRARLGVFGHCRFGCGEAGKARCGLCGRFRLGAVGFGEAGRVRHGTMWHGLAEWGKAGTVKERSATKMAETTTKARTNGAVVTEDEIGQVQIRRIASRTILVPIVGTAPLILHAFSAKAKQKMLDDMQGKRSPKEPKVPEAEYERAFYRLDDGVPGFPAVGFKSATVGAARFYGKDVTITGLRT